MERSPQSRAHRTDSGGRGRGSYHSREEEDGGTGPGKDRGAGSGGALEGGRLDVLAGKELGELKAAGLGDIRGTGLQGEVQQSPTPRQNQEHQPGGGWKGPGKACSTCHHGAHRWCS